MSTLSRDRLDPYTGSEAPEEEENEERFTEEESPVKDMAEDLDLSNENSKLKSKVVELESQVTKLEADKLEASRNSEVEKVEKEEIAVASKHQDEKKNEYHNFA